MVELIGPFVFFSVSLVVLLLAKDDRLENLLPVMEKGFLPNLYGSIAVVLRYVEIVFLAMISPYLNEPSKRNQAAILGIAIITFFSVLAQVAVLGLFEEVEPKNMTSPFFSAMRMIEVGNFLERIDAIHMSIWVLS